MKWPWSTPTHRLPKTTIAALLTYMGEQLRDYHEIRIDDLARHFGVPLKVAQRWVKQTRKFLQFTLREIPWEPGG